MVEVKTSRSFTFDFLKPVLNLFHVKVGIFVNYPRETYLQNFNFDFKIPTFYKKGVNYFGISFRK